MPLGFCKRAGWYLESYDLPKHQMCEASSFLGSGSQKYWTPFLMNREKSLLAILAWETSRLWESRELDGESALARHCLLLTALVANGEQVMR